MAATQVVFWILYKRHNINAWVTVNNNFLVMTKRRSNEWKLGANHLTGARKLDIHGDEWIIIFLLIRCSMSRTHDSPKNNHRSPISQFSPRTVFSDLTKDTRRYPSWIKQNVFTLGRHRCRRILSSVIWYGPPSVCLSICLSVCPKKTLPLKLLKDSLYQPTI